MEEYQTLLICLALAGGGACIPMLICLFLQKKHGKEKGKAIYAKIGYIAALIVFAIVDLAAAVIGGLVLLVIGFFGKMYRDNK